MRTFSLFDFPFLLSSLLSLGMSAQNLCLTEVSFWSFMISFQRTLVIFDVGFAATCWLITLLTLFHLWSESPDSSHEETYQPLNHPPVNTTNSRCPNRLNKLAGTNNAGSDVPCVSYKNLVETFHALFWGLNCRLLDLLTKFVLRRYRILVSALLKYLRLDHNSAGAIIQRSCEQSHGFVVHIFEGFDEPDGIFSSNRLNRLVCCKDSEPLALSDMYSQIEDSSDFLRQDRGDHVGF